MLKISLETLQKPPRSSPKRPTKPTTKQTSQKLPPKLRKFTKSLPKVAPKLPKSSKQIPKNSKKAPQKVPRNESWTEPRTGDPLFPQMSLKHSACHAFRGTKKTCLSMGTGSAFQFKKITSKCRNQEGQQRNFAKHVQGPSPPTSPPTQATAFANIAQHWLDKHQKNKKITENT